MQTNFNSMMAFLNVDTFLSNFVHHSHLFSQVGEGDAVSFLDNAMRSHLHETEVTTMKNLVQTLFHFYNKMPKVPLFGSVVNTPRL